MSQVMNPKVFISHASEDKERFVLEFATKLYSKGITAWVDKWEMNPGDSLVDKIFEEGIKDAHAIIVILSQYSVNKKWVREELNASMIAKINKGSKLIPVVIDECEVPGCLKATVWEKIEDINNYEPELEKIVMSIYGHYDRPPLGERPKYAQTIIDLIPGLTRLDSLILKLSCEKAIEADSFLHIETQGILEKTKSLDISSADVLECIEVLYGRGYISCRKVLGGGGLANIPHFSITNYGFGEYARVCINNYSSIIKSVALEIINNNKMNSDSLSEATKQPLLMIGHILDIFLDKGFIKASKLLAGRVLIQIYDVSPELKRSLKDW